MIEVWWSDSLFTFLDLVDLVVAVDVRAVLGESPCFLLSGWVVRHENKLVYDLLVGFNFRRNLSFWCSFISLFLKLELFLLLLTSESNNDIVYLVMACMSKHHFNSIVSFGDVLALSVIKDLLLGQCLDTLIWQIFSDLVIHLLSDFSTGK